MTDVRADPKLLAPIREALRSRRAALPDVRARAEALRPAAPSHPEESLRLLMVGCYPRIKRGEPLAGGDTLTALVAAVAARADWGDLRFIDALNALFEAWEPTYLPELRDIFIAHYDTALARMLLDQ
jgi:hypothetical protein